MVNTGEWSQFNYDPDLSVVVNTGPDQGSGDGGDGNSTLLAEVLVPLLVGLVLLGVIVIIVAGVIFLTVKKKLFRKRVAEAVSATLED